MLQVFIELIPIISTLYKYNIFKRKKEKLK
ncbi:hypothetical protein HNQ03_002551 [Chryseobacterium sp. 16F]|uniref:Uncharacterized protein n=1 Tax=Frigoriflavimonas asaccharolytica TaxID=2735899 RepID=A0A8J8G8V7_9FLAO|nr:hypothetical protein [Frigoriflavimonas asaccharolytica]